MLSAVELAAVAQAATFLSTSGSTSARSC